MKKMVLVMMVVALAVPALAQEPPEMGRAKAMVAGFLDLTPDQVAQWDALMEDSKAVVEPIAAELKAVEEELQGLLAGESPDPAAVGALVLHGKELRDALAEAHLNYARAFEAILVPQQTARFLAVRRAARLEPVLPAFRLFRLLPK